MDKSNIKKDENSTKNLSINTDEKKKVESPVKKTGTTNDKQVRKKTCLT